MKNYTKYILKDIKVLLPKLLAITLIVILGVGFTLGLFTAAPNMRYSVERFYKDTNVADAIIQGMPFEEDLLNELKGNELIDDVFAYYSFDEDVEFRNGNHLAQINIIDFKKDINLNKLTLIEGRFPNPDAEDIEVVIERKQPFLIDVPMNYETTFLDKKVKVVGVVHSPWYFAFVEEISLSKQRPIEIILYADRALLSEDQYTNVAIKLKDAKNYNFFSSKYEEVIEGSIEKLKEVYPNFYFSTLKTNQSYAKYSSDVKIVEAIALIFPLFFILVTILVSIASMTKIVEDQRRQIGTLTSLGYGKFKIIFKYVLYAVIASAVGTVVGIALGVYFIPAIVYNAYKTIYNLPEFTIQYYFDYTSVIAAVMIASVVLVTIGSISARLKEKPTELLRVKTPKPGKKILLERIGFIWKGLKFKYKSTFRNIFRYKRNLFLSIIGVMGSTALLLAGFGIKDSVDLAGKYQYEEMLNYNIEISVNENKQILEFRNYKKLYVSANNAEYNKDYISAIIFSDNKKANDFIKFKNVDGTEFEFTSDSFVITKSFADKHNLNVGDEIKVNINNKEYELTITNIQEYYFGNYMFIGTDYINDGFKINKIYIKDSLSEQEQNELKEKLKEYEFISKVSFKDDMKYSYLKTSESMNSIIVVLVLSASALAIIIYYNLTIINIHTRKREIATLKVLGYQEVEVSGYVFREMFIISIFAIILGLLLGKILHSFIISQIVVDGILLVNNIRVFSYLYSTVLAFSFLGLVYLLTLPETRRIDMVEALKSYE